MARNVSRIEIDFHESSSHYKSTLDELLGVQQNMYDLDVVNSYCLVEWRLSKHVGDVQVYDTLLEQVLQEGSAALAFREDMEEMVLVWAEA